MLDHAGIAACHHEGLAAVLLQGDHEIGALFLADLAVKRIIPAAGLGAHSAIGIAADHVIGEQTTAAVRHAHRAVDKGFKLQILGDRGANGLDLIE